MKTKLFKQAIIGLALLAGSAWGQETSNNNFTGAWSDGTSWQDGPAPSSDFDGDIVINGYITNSADTLIISGDVTINDTLVVEGNLNMDQDNSTLTISSGGLLIVLGDMFLANRINISNNGVIAVGGTFDKNGSSNQGTFTGSGKVYADDYGNLGGPGNPNAGTWIDNNTGNNQQSESVTDLSGDGLGDIQDFILLGSPLPVTITYFTISTENSYALLEWETATEENFSHFEIERSVDGVNWEYVGYVNGQGNKYSPTQYTYSDYQIQNSISYYRLKAIDYDGYTEYFGPVMVHAEVSADLIIQHSPAGFLITSGVELSMVQVFDLNGSAIPVTRKDHGFEMGAQQGNYIIKAIDTEGNLITKKVALRNY